MNKAFEKILERLEKLRQEQIKELCEHKDFTSEMQAMRGHNILQDAKKIVQEVAEEYKDGWIPVSSGILPDIAINPVTNDYVRYNVTYQNGDIVDTRNYAYGEAAGGKHWLNGGQIMDKYVTAWQPQPEPYRGNE